MSPAPGETAAAEGLSWTIIALGACVSFAFLWTFDKAFRTLFAPIMLRLAGIELNAKFVHWAPFGWLGTIVTKVEKWTRNGMAASERAIVYGFGAALSAFRDLAVTIETLARDYYRAQKAAWAAIDRLQGYVGGKVGHAVAAFVHVVVNKAIYAERRFVRSSIAALRAAVHQTAIALPRIGAKADHWGGITAKQVRRLDRRLTKLEKLTAGLGVAALTWTALKRLGLGWLRCTRVRKVGNAVCGMSPSLVESLLFDVATLTVAFNIRTFAQEMQAVVEDGADLIHKWAS
jgi:hypothetical protein